MQREGTKGFSVGQEWSLSYILKACSGVCVKKNLKEGKLLQASKHSGAWARVGALEEMDGWKRWQEVDSSCLGDLSTVGL